MRIRPRPWKWLAAELLIWLLPITQVPGEIARQFVGWYLTGRIENLYFTKTRPDRVYALELCPRQTWVEVFGRTKLSYQYDTKEVLMDGGGISGWVQIPRTPVLFLKLRASLEGN
ncbi:MAG: hypothetical protein HY912_10500 [Desulfomonile tiedjei]|uniref:Uncharacterized protein n=1 Tax=Desulfomonile tiedjei TaxID=2358 RepID=A0A9D6Z0G0_9BACT|nr:hypothetical protein [Desulfomonile tiedjei]